MQKARLICIPNIFIQHQDSGRAEMCSTNIAGNDTDHSKQLVSTAQETTEGFSEIPGVISMLKHYLIN